VKRIIGTLLYWLATPRARRRQAVTPARAVGVARPSPGRHASDNPRRTIVPADWMPESTTSVRPRITYRELVPADWTPVIGAARIAALLDDTGEWPTREKRERWHANLPALPVGTSW
jgi:hypothetical protein